MEKVPNKVDNILTKDASSFQEVKKKILNLYSAGGNSDLAHHTFSSKKHKNSKRGTKSSGSSSSKPDPSSSFKDTASSSKAKTCTWYTNHPPSKTNGYSWHEYFMLKEFNKSVPKYKGNRKEQYIAKNNLDTDSKVEGLIHHDAKVSTTTKWIFDSRASTYMMPDGILFQDIRPIRSQVRVGNGVRISVYIISTVSLFVVLKDGSIKNIILQDCLYVFGQMKSLFSWSKFKSLNQHYLEDRGNILVRKLVNNNVILWAKECLHTHLFNIPTRTLEAHMTYTFWHKALRYPSHDLMRFVNVFSDGDLILSKPKAFDCDSCLQSKSIHKVPKTLQNDVKLKFNIIYSDVYSPLANQSLGGNRYVVIFIDKFS
jgi:hypothetical protein